MSIYPLQGSDTSLLRLLEVTQTGEEVVITHNGKPIARMVSCVNNRDISTKREVGFYPIEATSDLLSPTDESIIESFYKDAVTS
jgi:antitoxin (DNA-binding transcriptional repressor) of toxin-antitoxin stability system